MTSNRPGALPLYLAAAWAALAVHASLYPFSGWRDTGAAPLAFLSAAWPRYFTAFDLAMNLAAYIPLGFLLFVAGRRRLRGAQALLLAVTAGFALSLVLELLQNYLPSRVASNLDLACNTGGTLLGALAGVRWGGNLLSHGRLAHLRQHWFAERRGIDSGLLLLGLWLIALLDPAALPFGSGDLRPLLELGREVSFSATRFSAFEAGIAASGMLSAILLTSLIAAPRQRRRLPLLLVALALLVKSFAYALFFGPAQALAWASPGTLAGLLLAMLAGYAAAHLVAPAQRALAALSLLLATTLINLAPANPYLDYARHVWNPGQFLNFHGLTQFIAALWPFPALAWLMLLSTKDDT